jgi:hypothetical protein
MLLSLIHMFADIFEFYLFYFVHFATTVRPDHVSTIQ